MISADDERAAEVDGYAHALFDYTYDGEPWESCDEDEKDEFRRRAAERLEVSRRRYVEANR